MELMVVMALTIFIMVILTEAFIIASDTFSGLKTIGDMQEQLRTAINVVKTDRKGPTRITGQGVGFQDTTIYEVIFADGSRQRVESTTFVPQKN